MPKHDPNTVLNRLAALIWILEGVAAHGWATGSTSKTHRRPLASSSPSGDPIAARWLNNLTARVDSMTDKYLARLDERHQTRINHELTPVIPLKHAELKAIIQDRAARCPSCGTRQDTRGLI